MHVLFVAPHFPSYQKQFVRALFQVGAKVTGIGEAPAAMLPKDLRNWLYDYEQVSSVCSDTAMLETVRKIQKRGWVDRLEATIEAHMLTAARTREACGIPGMSYEQTVICRDKTIMKEFMRKHGVPTAQSTSVASAQDVLQFARKHGFPLILKPRAGAGASGTWRINSEADLTAILPETGLLHGNSMAIEEFIEGHEGFYDTLTVGHQIAHEFVSHYYPNVLEAMRHRNVAPVIITSNRIDSPGYQELKVLGRKVIEKLQLHTAPTHMEWFYGPKGLKFSEIGARPPGVGQWDLYCAANDIDLYREWAAGIVLGKTLERPSRKYSAAIITIRPTGDGHIKAYQGLEAVEKQYGKWFIKSYFPPVGARTQPVEAGYMANAWIQMKYPDYDELRAILADIGNRIQIIAN